MKINMRGGEKCAVVWPWQVKKEYEGKMVGWKLVGSVCANAQATAYVVTERPRRNRGKVKCLKT